MLKRLTFSFFALFWASVAVASGITSPSNYNAANVAITGGSIAGATITGGSLNTINATVTTLTTYAIKSPSGKFLTFGAAPTIASGFGTGASIPPATANGTAAFVLYTGTGATTADGILTFPAASNGWICNAMQASGWAYYISFIPFSTTQVHVTQTAITTGALVNWGPQTLYVTCTGY